MSEFVKDWPLLSGQATQEGQSLEERAQALYVKTHRIKGGAGFFGLTEIETTAAELQNLAEGGDCASVLWVELVSRLRSSFEALPEFADHAPDLSGTNDHA